MTRRCRQQVRRTLTWFLTLAFCAIVSVLVRPVPVGAATQQVGLVVQTGPRAKPTVSCVSWTKGMTGFDVLRAADHDIAWQARTYTVLQIDAVPTPVTFDATHYWAYFTRAPGKKWVRSTKPGATSLPQPGAVEGWFYVSGSPYTPPDVTFASACRTAPASPGRTVTPTASTSRTSTPPRTTSTSASPSRSASTSASRSVATPSRSRTSGQTTPHPTTTTAGPQVPPPGAHRTTAGPLLGFAFGGVALAIGVAAGAVALQRRRGAGS